MNVRLIMVVVEIAVKILLEVLGVPVIWKDTILDQMREHALVCIINGCLHH